MFNKDMFKPTVKDRKEEIRQMLEMQKAIDSMTAEYSVHNTEIEEKGKDTKDYGLSKDNPVFVNGFIAGTNYLTHLYTLDGKKLVFERNGSTVGKGIAGFVDEYTAYYADTKKKKGLIYICNYGTKVNTTPPVGYKYK